jgi:hypothetical protein
MPQLPLHFKGLTSTDRAESSSSAWVVTFYCVGWLENGSKAVVLFNTRPSLSRTYYFSFLKYLKCKISKLYGY